MPRGRKKRQPQRTCIGCRQTITKRELVRLVRTPEGRIVIDPTGKAAGRGAYLCARSECWRKALAERQIARALKTQLSERDRAAIETFMAQLPQEDGESDLGEMAERS